MPNPYSQLASVYFRRPFRSLTMGIFVCNGLLSLTVSLLGQPHLERVLPQLAGSMIFLNMVVWLIFYEQIATHRLRLFPGFLWPQLLTFTIFAGTVLGVDILGLYRCPNASITGCIALIVGFFSIMGVAILLQSSLLFSAGVGVFFWILYGSGFVVIQHIFDGTLANIAIAMAIGSFVLIAMVLWRFFNLHEECTAFQTPLGFDGAILKSTVTGDQNRAWANMKETGPWMWLVDTLSPAMVPNHSIWGTVQRWRYSYNSRMLPIMAAAMAVPMSYISYQTRNVSGVQNVPLYPCMILFMLMLSAPVGWLQRWRYVEAESLRPVERALFFKQLGLAMAIDFVLIFIVGFTATLLPMWVGGPGLIFSSSFLTAVILSAAAFTLMFGYSAWVIRFRSPGKLIVSILFLCPISILPTFIDQPMSPERYLHVLLLAGAFVVSTIGIALARRGYQLWLTTELG